VATILTSSSPGFYRFCNGKVGTWASKGGHGPPAPRVSAIDTKVALSRKWS